jgi:hypothetical protein
LHAFTVQKTKIEMKTGVFWDAAPWNLVEIGRRFKDAYYLHHQGGE